MDMQSAIRALCQRRDLSVAEMQDVMTIIMSGEATPAQIGGLLVALHVKGETVDEITGAALIMRRFADGVRVTSERVVDTVGTGGDSARLFNVSTAAALVTAAAGVTVAKHGNRAATGRSGSADVLEKAGVNIALDSVQVGQTIDTVGIGFMFAPNHHGATRHAIGPRREIGVRSIFNLLGPLTNPAGARYQLVGVFERRWVHPIAEVFRGLGSVHTLVVQSDDGLDEISIAAPTAVSELKDGAVADYAITPEQFGVDRQSLDPLVVDSAADSLRLMRSALSGERGPAYDIVALNAGATLYAADHVDDLKQGVNEARKVLDSGKAIDKLAELADFTSRFVGLT